MQVKIDTASMELAIMEKTKYIKELEGTLTEAVTHKLSHEKHIKQYEENLK